MIKKKPTEILQKKVKTIKESAIEMEKKFLNAVFLK